MVFTRHRISLFLADFARDNIVEESIHTIFHREFLGDWKVSESIFALFDQIGKCQNWKADTYQF